MALDCEGREAVTRVSREKQQAIPERDFLNRPCRILKTAEVIKARVL